MADNTDHAVVTKATMPAAVPSPAPQGPTPRGDDATAQLRGVPTPPLAGQRPAPRRPGPAVGRPGQPGQRPVGAPRPTRPAEGTAMVQVGPRQVRGVDPSAPVQIARGTLSELGHFIDSQVHAYRMAGEAAAREARTATELAATRDELVGELRHRIEEREREIAAVTSKLELARAEADTLRLQLSTVNEIVAGKAAELQRKRGLFGRR
jgi:hypothetical protein